MGQTNDCTTFFWLVNSDPTKVVLINISGCVVRMQRRHGPRNNRTSHMWKGVDFRLVVHAYSTGRSKTKHPKMSMSKMADIAASSTKRHI